VVETEKSGDTFDLAVGQLQNGDPGNFLSVLLILCLQFSACALQHAPRKFFCVCFTKEAVTGRRGIVCHAAVLKRTKQTTNVDRSATAVGQWDAVGKFQRLAVLTHV
jgi:hypothetical protein